MSWHTPLRRSAVAQHDAARAPADQFLPVVTSRDGRHLSGGQFNPLPAALFLPMLDQRVRPEGDKQGASVADALFARCVCKPGVIYNNHSEVIA